MNFSYLQESEIYIKLLISVVIFLTSFPISSLLSKIIKKMLFKANTEKSAILFTLSSIKIVLKILFFLLSFTLFIDLKIMLATAGTSAAILGIIFKDVLSNLISGIMIMSNKLFKVEDYLKVGEDEGFVQKIEIFFTTLKTSDKKEIIIPNSVLTSKSVTKCAQK